MLNTGTSTVIGVFEDTSDAIQAVRALREAGFEDARIGIASKDERTTREKFGLTNDPTHSKWEQGTVVGAAAGGATGLGLGLAVVAGLIPPLGPVLVGGTLLALLASAGTGAAVGTVVGGLAGLGVSEDEAGYYDREFQAGRTLVTVRPAARPGWASGWPWSPGSSRRSARSSWAAR